MKPVCLRCEYKENPLGLDTATPRMTWKLEAKGRHQVQKAYQVLAASSEGALAKDQADLWDSGKVISDQSVLVAYAGKPLTSAQRVFWKVRVWDGADRATAWSPAAWWEMGLLHQKDWTAKWIGSLVVGGPTAPVACPFLRKSFKLDRKVTSARLYVTALGLYEFYLNGKRVGDGEFTPGWTDYAKRVQYQVYDVTKLLVQGANAGGAILGDGWYCGHTGWKQRQNYGDRPKLLAQLVIRYKDGTSQTIATDGTWKTSTGPILSSDLLMGESYDARLELGEWSKAGYDDKEWSSVKVFPEIGAKLAASPSRPVRRFEEIKPISTPKNMGGWPSGKWVFDLGQNMVGHLRIKISAPAGTTITLRHAEMLKPDGNIYTDNLRGALQTDVYTFKGKGTEVWEPRFTFHGFRYAELTGLTGEAQADMLTGVVLHTDIPPAGTFECSDPLINQLQHNILWGQKGNFLEVPTDCPQRNERLGWTGDAQVFSSTAAFNREVAPFFAKWLRDMDDAQTSKGAYPMYSPNIGGVDSQDGGPVWADASVICAWNMYLYYGDKGILAEHYPALERFMGYLAKTSADKIRCKPGWGGFEGFGDWLSINAETSKDLIGTAFYAYSAGLMAGIAAALGKKEDAKKYKTLADEVRKVFIHRFVTPAGLVAGQTQTAYVLALKFDLLPEALRPVAVAELVRDIEGRGNHLSTGFVGASHLPHVLSRFGRMDTAYTLLFQKTWPSWLYPVTQGATTIWERWDGWTHDKGFQDAGMNSFNHYAYGAIGSWLYQVVAGLQADPEKPGYKHFILHPHPGPGITSAKAVHESVYGRIVTDWKIKGKELAWNVEVPVNTTATVIIPAKNGKVREGGQPIRQSRDIKVVKADKKSVALSLGSGKYAFMSNYF